MKEKKEDRRFHVTTILGLMAKYGLRAWHGIVVAEYFKNEILDKIENGELALEDIKALDTDQLIKDAKEAPSLIAKEEAGKGKRVHALAEYLFRQMMEKKDVEIEVDPDIKEPFGQLVEIVKEHKMQPIAVELDVEYDKDGFFYKGRLDYLGFFDNVIVVSDHKTTSGIWDDHPLQLGAYWLALQEEIKKNPELKGVRLAGGLIIRLDKYTGNPEIKFYPNREMKDYADEFLLWDAIYIKRQNRKELRKELRKKRKKQIKEDGF